MIELHFKTLEIVIHFMQLPTVQFKSLESKQARRRRVNNRYKIVGGCTTRGNCTAAGAWRRRVNNQHKIVQQEAIALQQEEKSGANRFRPLCTLPVSPLSQMLLHYTASFFPLKCFYCTPENSFKCSAVHCLTAVHVSLHCTLLRFILYRCNTPPDAAIALYLH